MDRLFREINNESFNIRHVTKGALSQARRKLKPEAFKRLNTIAVDTFYQGAPYLEWNGHRVLAVDGSTCVLPRHKSTIEKYGSNGYGPNATSEQVLARLSLLYDVFNQITLDAQIAPLAKGERELLDMHLGYLQQGDLLLLDRGYPSIRLLYQLYSTGIEFCIRLGEHSWVKARQLVESGDKEQVVEFELPPKDLAELAEYPAIAIEKLRFRLVKIELPDGGIEILCTSLMDCEKYTYQELAELYHYRWNVEEAYKLLKCRTELENFSGKTAIAVEQDFYATVLTMTLCASFAHPIEQKVRQEYKADEKRKHDQKINRTNALATLKGLYIGMFIHKQIEKALAYFDPIVKSTREIIRPGRKHPRKHKPKNGKYMNYKSL